MVMKRASLQGPRLGGKALPESPQVYSRKP
jgi:hypothetical protein